MGKVSVIGQRVRRRMVELDISTVKELEGMAGLPRDSIRHLISGRTNSMRAGKLPALAAALKMSVEELVNGTPLAGDAAALVMPLADQIAPTTMLGRMRFDMATLTAFGATPHSSLRWIVAVADNMQPTIQAGDVVMVDASVQEVTGDGIYCLQMSSGSMVFRRVQVMAVGGGANVCSDNANYTAEAIDDVKKIEVLGRVLGVFHKV